MIQDFRILHRRKPYVFAAPEAPVWSTCLRSLAFSSQKEEAHDEVYQREQAYRFLLEVICGMHSPIVGETEVFGQFKAFAQDWIAREPQRAGLVQRLMGDAKQIRSTYLRGLGHQSYGSWVRGQLKSDVVHIVGGGHLVREILPFVAKRAKETHLHARDPRKIDFHNGRVHELAAQSFTGGALVIAAPVTAAELEAWLGGHVPSQIFDLRETATSDELVLKTERHLLQEIFSSIEQNKSRLAPVIAQVRGAIEDCTRKFAAQAIIRPQGWDDLCA